MQQQQTVLRVQTNIPNGDVTYSGEISKVSTSGWTITGDGSVDIPYSGISTGYGDAIFAIENGV